MKIRNIVSVEAVLLVTATGARAAHVWEDPNVWWASHFTYDTAGTPRYTAAELSFDVSAVMSPMNAALRSYSRPT